jgi:hypothetical protein
LYRLGLLTCIGGGAGGGFGLGGGGFGLAGGRVVSWQASHAHSPLVSSKLKGWPSAPTPRAVYLNFDRESCFGSSPTGGGVSSGLTGVSYQRLILV